MPSYMRKAPGIPGAFLFSAYASILHFKPISAALYLQNTLTLETNLNAVTGHFWPFKHRVFSFLSDVPGGPGWLVFCHPGIFHFMSEKIFAGSESKNLRRFFGRFLSLDPLYAAKVAKFFGNFFETIRPLESATPHIWLR